MAKRIKIDDIVQVIAGKDKGKQGKVTNVNSKLDKVIVEGINVSKVHKKKTEQSEGGIIEVSRPIHQSNVMLVCPEKKVPTRVGYKSIKNGTKKRVAKATRSTF